ncbi:hypothetical protein [Actinoalloteichus hymeniacidonis]|uniref:Extracellular solute-binding protein n=1 Tax=Actinoalloteichus hymeniacidonis TaxID=340345 RepID=A0AAC9HMV9_9PSEU|nr:hypothetical protein [Actinoalloteichus hymeniacidonis]AOS62092.1 hypothetical protein TL08_06335 [Actinoalloteichus hymeniacidonis]MBB5909886.1 hypothetical protein [Actinoalloteichus hymeniacidonis]
MKRGLSIALAAVLLIAVGVAIILGRDEDDTELTSVRGVIGSEKLAFFQDERVREAFAEHGLEVEVDSAGSRQIATSVALGEYAFAFPASSPAAERIQRDRDVSTVYEPFESPMAVASFAPIVELLTEQGVVRSAGAGHQVLDIAAYLELTRADTRWDELPDNTEFPARKNVLITTTDPRESNSAAMYLSIVSYVANDEAVVASTEDEAEVVAEVGELFLDQGYTQNTTEGPFEDYLGSGGMGRTPLALIYESQFLDRQIRGDGSINDDMRLLYTSPTVFSTHTLVPLTDDGDQVGRLLTEDPELSRLAAVYGFRTSDPGQLGEIAAEHDVPVPPELVDVVEPPSFETLERLLDDIAEQY